jgi:hypothetical protein
MRVRLIVISRVGGQSTAQVTLAIDQHLIQAFPAKRPDQVFSSAILQGEPRLIGRSQIPIAFTRHGRMAILRG